MRRYWIWYDNLNEPYRVFMAMFMMAPILIGTALTGISPLFPIGGMLFVFILLINRFCLFHARKS